MVKKKLLNIKHTRHPNQKTKMKQLLKEGVCPFCPKYLEKYHDSPILKKGKYWSITLNDYPYSETKYHFLIISKKHLVKASEISRLAGTELIDHLNWLSKKYKINTGIFLMRFGDTKKTGATVEHLHYHLIVGSRKDQALQFFVGYKK